MIFDLLSSFIHYKPPQRRQRIMIFLNSMPDNTTTTAPEAKVMDHHGSKNDGKKKKKKKPTSQEDGGAADAAATGLACCGVISCCVCCEACCDIVGYWRLSDLLDRCVPGATSLIYDFCYEWIRSSQNLWPRRKYSTLNRRWVEYFWYVNDISSPIEGRQMNSTDGNEDILLYGDLFI